MRRTAAYAICLSCLALAGCGEGSPNSKKVHTETFLPSTLAPTGDPSSVSADDASATRRYVRCMRLHGVAMPDPRSNGNLRLTPRQEKIIEGVPRQLRSRANAACKHLLPEVDRLPLSRAAQKKALLVVM